MKTKECNIVQDLLPNYIEGLVSRETSEFVKKHIDCLLYTSPSPRDS